jgi:hypothetical protein
MTEGEIRRHEVYSVGRLSLRVSRWIVYTKTMVKPAGVVRPFGLFVHVTTTTPATQA